EERTRAPDITTETIARPTPETIAPATPAPTTSDSQSLSIDENQPPPNLDSNANLDAAINPDFAPIAPTVEAPETVEEPEATDEPEAIISAQSFSHPENFGAVVQLFEEYREGILTKHLRHDLHLVAFAPGRIEFRPSELAPRDLASKLSQHLSEWTGMRWIVTVSSEPGAATLAQQEETLKAERLHDAESHPMVDAVRAHFPGATINRVTMRETPPKQNSTDDASDNLPAQDIPKGGAQR
ncbi:MAG: hypothetical protein JKY20_02985, partial [Alphaproteobacteria bacterium]|nr:hypothetical protein [Alphaproteobacteria bacterium]